jgi:hypothetical protein
LRGSRQRQHLFLFLDESGKPGDKTFAVGGVAIAADCWVEQRSGYRRDIRGLVYSLLTLPRP